MRGPGKWSYYTSDKDSCNIHRIGRDVKNFVPSPKHQLLWNVKVSTTAIFNQNDIALGFQICSQTFNLSNNMLVGFGTAEC